MKEDEINKKMLRRIQFQMKTDEKTSLRAAFLKLWSADHTWSSGSALVVLLD